MPHTRTFSCRIARGAAPWADMSGEPPKKKAVCKTSYYLQFRRQSYESTEGEGLARGAGNGKRISAHPSAKKALPQVRDTKSNQCLPARAPRGRPAESIHKVPPPAIRA